MAETRISDDWVGTISLASDNLAIKLPGGNWKFSKPGYDPRLRDVSIHTAAARAQRFVCVKVPGSENYHIFNLYYGVFLGVFPQEQTSESYECRIGPCSVESLDITWKIVDAGSAGLFGLCWRPDHAQDHKYLELQPNSQSPNLHVGKKRNDFNSSQQWQFFKDETLSQPHEALTDWMQNIPDDTKLSMVNIPATHESLALHALGSEADGDIPAWYLLDNPRCQSRSPYEQLLDGIRGFDLRLMMQTQPNCLRARHGTKVIGADEGYSLLAFLHSLNMFLTQHPHETVLVGIRPEPDADGWLQAFEKDFSTFWKDTSIIYQDNKLSFSELKIGQVRGKAILISEKLFTASAGNPNYPASCPFYNRDVLYPRAEAKVEGTWDIPKSEWPSKLMRCKANIDLALQAKDDQLIFKTGWNMSQGNPFLGATYNPWDFAKYARHPPQKSHCIQEVLSSERLGKGTNDTWKRVGIVEFDFYHLFQDAIQNTICSNRGCGSLVFG